MLYDTGGQEAFEQLRPLSYSNANVIVICYDIARQASYENVTAIWKPETEHFCPGIPVILVACKTDLRQRSTDMEQDADFNEDMNSKKLSTQSRIISTAEVRK